MAGGGRPTPAVQQLGLFATPSPVEERVTARLHANVATLDDLAKVKEVQQRTGRMYMVSFSERFGNRSTVKAGELVAYVERSHVLA